MIICTMVPIRHGIFQSREYSLEEGVERFVAKRQSNE